MAIKMAFFKAPVKVRIPFLFIRCITGFFAEILGLFDVFYQPGVKGRCPVMNH